MASSSSVFPTQLILCILIIASSCVVQISGRSSGGVEEELQSGLVGRTQREFDYFKLALQWPGTYCRRTRHCCSSNGCCKNSNSLNEFTIHGLWPDYNDGSWPSCCSGPTFDAKEISTLNGTLEKYWPTLSCSSPSNCHGGKGTFWGHEWEKHGTCSFPVFRDEYNYFLTALNVYFKYNVTAVLNEAGYVPSNSEKYPLGGIISAIQNAFHTTPQVTCSNGAVGELYLCFYKDFTPRDCATETRIESYLGKSSCPRYVSLPIKVSSGLAHEEVAFHQSA